MICESKYREMALEVWERERTNIEDELMQMIKQKQSFLACILNWFKKHL